MAKDFLTDAQVEVEIERLSNSPFVKLAIAENRNNYRRRQRMYQLRSWEKRGIELDKQGYTLENIAYKMGVNEEEYDA